jgi:hypothetical protein
MTTEEFGNKYMNENILEIFDDTCDFFTNELPKEFVENYDVGEVILETRGHHETAKEFDKVLKFTELLQEKQPKLYKEYFQYFDDFLVDFYCFQNNPSKVAIAFSNFIMNPIQGFDAYLISFKKLLFYGYTDILNSAITKNYETIDTSEHLIGGAAGYDLALSKFYITLEEFYQKNTDSVAFNKNEFLDKLDKYDFDFDEKVLSAIETGISKTIPGESMVNSFIHDRKNYIITLEMCFLKYMHTRKFSFALSGRLWDKLLDFWEDINNKKKCKPNDYFLIQTSEFEKYLLRLSGDMFIDNKSEMIAVLWGSVYIYEFLKSIEIIDKMTFDKLIDVSRVLKGKVIGQYTSDLWNSNFVHVWEKPESISNIEFKEEEKIFKKSLVFKHQKFTRLRGEISEELNKIGGLSEFIINGGKSDDNDHNSKLSLLENLFSPKKDFKDSNDLYDESSNKPIKTEKKVGRNEPCPCGSGKKYKKCCLNQ